MQTHRHDRAMSLFATLQTHQKMATGRKSKVCAEMIGVHPFPSQLGQCFREANNWETLQSTLQQDYICGAGIKSHTLRLHYRQKTNMPLNHPLFSHKLQDTSHL